MPTSSENDPNQPLKPAPPRGVQPAMSSKLAAALAAGLKAQKAQREQELSTLAHPPGVPDPFARTPLTPLGQTADDPPPPVVPKKPTPAPVAPPIPEDTRPAFVRLENFAKIIKERSDGVKKLFAGTDYDPLKNKEFKKFLSDLVATVAMRYVRVGIVNSHDADAVPEEKEEQMRSRGFTVSSAPVAEATPVNETGDTTSPPNLDDNDARFMESTVVRQARELGFDPNSED